MDNADLLPINQFTFLSRMSSSFHVFFILTFHRNLECNVIPKSKLKYGIRTSSMKIG